MKREYQESETSGIGLLVFAAAAVWLLLFHSGIFN